MQNRKRRFLQSIAVLVAVSLLAGCGSTASAEPEAPTEPEAQEGLAPGYILHEESLVIPGLENSYEFLLVTDMHMAIKTQDFLNEQLGNFDDRMAGFKNSEGTASTEQFSYWISYANEHSESLDGFLMLGDMIDYYSAENAQYFAEKTAQLQIPYLYAIGNHEQYSPWNESIPGDSPLWTLFGKGDKNYQIWELDDLVICAVNDEPYEVNYYGTLGVYEAQKLGKPIILILHVPLCNANTQDLIEQSATTWGYAIVSGPGGLGDTDSTNELLDSITGEDSNVIAVFSGDNHFYYKGQLSDGVTEWVLDPAFSGNATHLTITGGTS